MLRLVLPYLGKCWSDRAYLYGILLRRGESSGPFADTTLNDGVWAPSNCQCDINVLSPLRGEGEGVFKVSPKEAHQVS